jgi:UDP-glucose 4-epimerase
MSKLLVTGGAGFIGSHIVDRLIKLGHEVIVLDNLSTGRKENLNSQAKFVECDISDYESIATYFSGVEAVFHLAALARIQPSIRDPLLANKSNITGTVNVLWAAKNAGVKKVIYSASSSVYGDQPAENYPLKETCEARPGSPYSLQKYVGELYCRLFSQLYGLPTVILRYFNVYGPRQITEGAYATVIGIFLKQRQEGKPMTVVEDGEEKRRDYTHVADVVEANMFAWQTDLPSAEVFNIGFGKHYSVTEVAELVGGPIVRIPKRPGEYLITWADNSKAKCLLAWEPKISLEEGIGDLKEIYHLP